VVVPFYSKKLSLLVIVNWGESRREGCSKNVRKVVPSWVNGAVPEPMHVTGRNFSSLRQKKLSPVLSSQMVVSFYG